MIIIIIIIHKHKYDINNITKNNPDLLYRICLLMLCTETKVIIKRSCYSAKTQIHFKCANYFS